jgi:metal-responsive CopG/Arc/MetJ family transcriptional regulator
MPKIKIEKDLFKKIKKYAEVAGYSSPEEFVAYALEKEVAQLDEAESDEEIKNKLKGLGYIS